MSENRTLLLDMGERLLAQLLERETDDAWPALRESGVHLLFRPEEVGGFAGDWGDAAALLRLSGLYPVNAPVAEILAAAWLEEKAGFERTNIVAALAGDARGEAGNGKFTGDVLHVPMAGGVESVVAGLGETIIRLDIADALEARKYQNTAGESRLHLTFRNAPVSASITPFDPISYGALAKTAQIAGALDGVLKLSIEHANERQQFGRPISKFQSVQQSLAILAEEAAAANCSAQAAALAADQGDAIFEIACAKFRAAKAAAIGAEIAHQIHGAIGFTMEHSLQLFTRRLAAWRTEFGNERFWSVKVGSWSTEEEGEALWPRLTDRSDQHRGA